MTWMRHAWQLSLTSRYSKAPRPRWGGNPNTSANATMARGEVRLGHGPWSFDDDDDVLGGVSNYERDYLPPGDY